MPEDRREDDIEVETTDLYKLLEENIDRPITLEKEDGIYQLLSGDGSSLSHTGFYHVEDDAKIISEMFYAYTRVVKTVVDNRGNVREVEYKRMMPFLMIFVKSNPEILKYIEPLNKDELDLDGLVITLRRKSLAESNLPTSMTLETAKKLQRLPYEELVKIANPKEIYNDIMNILKENVWLKDEIYYKLIGLWIIGTYFSDIFKIYPILHIYGSSGSGKTRLTSLIIALSRRGYLVTDPTESNLPRIIEGYRPTLGLDDFDIIMRKYKRYLITLLKHVYKDVASIPRLEKVQGDRFVLGLFSMYAPTVINSVDKLEAEIDESLATQLSMRYIEIEMLRSKAKFKTRDFIYEYRNVREKLYIMRFIYADKISQVYEDIDTKLYGRYDELWRPILTIAKTIDEELFQEIREYATSYVSQKEEDLYTEEKLLIRAIVNKWNSQNKLDKLQPITEIQFTASEILDTLRMILVEVEHEMTEKQFEKEWSVQRIGKILERMHIPKKRLKTAKRTRVRVVDKKLLEELKIRYGYIEEEEETPTS